MPKEEGPKTRKDARGLRWPEPDGDGERRTLAAPWSVRTPDNPESIPLLKQMAYDGIRGELPAWVPPVYRERFDDEREYLVACLGLGADQIRGCLDAHDEDGIATFPIRTGDGTPSRTSGISRTRSRSWLTYVGPSSTQIGKRGCGSSVMITQYAVTAISRARRREQTKRMRSSWLAERVVSTKPAVFGLKKSWPEEMSPESVPFAKLCMTLFRKMGIGSQQIPITFASGSRMQPREALCPFRPRLK
jgi:hypothetical protein